MEIKPGYKPPALGKHWITHRYWETTLNVEHSFSNVDFNHVIQAHVCHLRFLSALQSVHIALTEISVAWDSCREHYCYDVHALSLIPVKKGNLASCQVRSCLTAIISHPASMQWPWNKVELCFLSSGQFVCSISQWFLQSITVISSLLIRDGCGSCSQLVVFYCILISLAWALCCNIMQHRISTIKQYFPMWTVATTTFVQAYRKKEQLSIYEYSCRGIHKWNPIGQLNGPTGWRLRVPNLHALFQVTRLLIGKATQCSRQTKITTTRKQNDNTKLHGDQIWQ